MSKTRTCAADRPGGLESERQHGTCPAYDGRARRYHRFHISPFAGERLQGAEQLTMHSEGRIRAPKDLIQRLEDREIGCAIAANKRRNWKPVTCGSHFGSRSGVGRYRMQASDRTCATRTGPSRGSHQYRARVADLQRSGAKVGTGHTSSSPSG